MILSLTISSVSIMSYSWRRIDNFTLASNNLLPRNTKLKWIWEPSEGATSCKLRQTSLGVVYACNLLSCSQSGIDRSKKLEIPGESKLWNLLEWRGKKTAPFAWLSLSRMILFQFQVAVTSIFFTTSAWRHLSIPIKAEIKKSLALSVESQSTPKSCKRESLSRSWNPKRRALAFPSFK